MMIELTPDQMRNMAACPKCGAARGELCRRVNAIPNAEPILYQAVHAHRAEAAERVALAAISRHPGETGELTVAEKRIHRTMVTDAIGELAEAITAAELDNLHTPEVVTALAAVLALGGRDDLGQQLIEAQADAHPDEWAEHSRRQAEAMAWQHEEDEHRENGDL